MIDPRVAMLKHWGQYPIPFFATIKEDGTPDFKVVDEIKRIRCYTERLCWVCGDKLGRNIAFIGGPQSTENGFYVDGPMHKGCAETAMEICPYLVGAMDYAKKIDTSHVEGVVYALDERAKIQKPPDRVALSIGYNFLMGKLPGKDYLVFQLLGKHSETWYERKGHHAEKTNGPAETKEEA